MLVRCLWKSSYAHQGCTHLIKRPVRATILKYYHFNHAFKNNLFLWWQSWIFSSHNYSLQWPFRNQSNMLICSSRNITCSWLIFLSKHLTRNIINVFTVTFVQFNASLLYQVFISFKMSYKKTYWPQTSKLFITQLLHEYVLYFRKVANICETYLRTNYFLRKHWWNYTEQVHSCSLPSHPLGLLPFPLRFLQFFPLVKSLCHAFLGCLVHMV